ncbi:hypothetical protein CVT26_007808 [Gymnopilus dilepis]|uniref:BED-type domain-containing protein n=1 Tax=Gymnopilus dilepis TaxID=231916 RepID=A0A409WES3_9AGAR|nr:hypothetical protein CVT26_007808 [Gymnopilus dilepis]
MAPRKQVDVVHDNSSRQTVFPINVPQKRTARNTGKSKAKAKTVAPEDNVDPPPIAQEHATPKRERGRKAQEARAAAPEAAAAVPASQPAHPVRDETENPFLPSSNQPSPPGGQDEREQATAVAIPSSQTPRAGRHSPSRASPEVAAARQKAQRSASDMRIFFQNEKGRWYCKFCLRDHGSFSKCDSYKGTSGTSTLRRHLYTKHLEDWINGCKAAGIKITATEEDVQKALEEFNRQQGLENESQATGGPVPIYHPYSPEAFVDAIVEWIVSDDQSLNVTENPHLRSIFLMLRKELRDKDIPHRTTICNRVMEMWEKHVKDLEKDMQKALGKVSFTADCWTDTNLMPFMAITGHWLECRVKNSPNGPRYVINLRSELIAFHRVPGRHTGEHLATVFLNILDRYKITKVGWITLDNASNNDTMVESLEAQLAARGVEFSSVKQRISIAVQAVLASVTNMDFAKENADHFNPSFSTTNDVIASLRSLINKI